MKLKTGFCAGARACAGIASSAFADTWSGAYGNTIVSTYSDGRVVKVYVEPDHSYSLTLPNGDRLNGTWADGSDGSCFTVTNPPPAPGAKPTCFPLKDYKVGDTFEGADSSGSFKGVVQAGRCARAAPHAEGDGVGKIGTAAAYPVGQLRFDGRDHAATFRRSARVDGTRGPAQRAR